MSPIPSPLPETPTGNVSPAPATLSREEAAPRVRPAAPADLTAVRRLVAAASLPTAGLEDHFPGGYAVAVAGEEVVGVLGIEVHGSWGLVRSAAVAPSFRGRGVGQALFTDRLAWSRARDLAGLFLATTTAVPWFSRAGFTAVGREEVPAEVLASRELSEACPASATLMALPLTSEEARGGTPPDPVPGTALDGETLRRQVRERYAAAAREANAGARAGCGCSCGSANPITSDLYTPEDVAEIPPTAFLASLGCGNPTALAELRPGETVLDLGSGGGIDVLLSARRVGPGGKAYGLDMTGEMLELARDNQRRAGVENAEFLEGELEAIPLPEASVDVVISNCVLNLSADKGRALEEAFRVLKPGGRFAVSDIVLADELPPEARRSVSLWTGCVAGALTVGAYRRLLAAAGFEAVGIEPTRVFRSEDAHDMLAAAGFPAGEAEALAAAMDGKVMSAFVRARKPIGAADSA